MQLHSKTKKYLSLLLALVMLFSMAIPASAEEGDPAETSSAKLYVRKVGTENLAQSLTITANTPVEFFYGDPATGVVMVTDTELDGSPLGFNPAGNGAYTIDGTVGQTYTVKHTESGTSVTLTFEAENQPPAETPKLRARIIGSSDLMDSLSTDHSTQVIFYYGLAGNSDDSAKVTGSSALSHTGFAMEYKGTVDGETDVWEISFPDNSTSGTVTHQASSATFAVTYTGTTDQNSGSQDPCLFAQFAGEDTFTPSMGISPGVESSLIFYYGVYKSENAVEITNPNALTKTDGVNLEYDAANGFWKLSLQDNVEAGTVTYTSSDNNTASFYITLVKDDQGGSQDLCLFAVDESGAAYSSPMALSPDGPMQLKFYYGMFGDKDATEITNPNAFNAGDGVVLEYNETTKYWNTDLYDGFREGEFTYRIDENQSVTFALTRHSDNNSGDGGDYIDPVLFVWDITNDRILTSVELTAGQTLDVEFRHGIQNNYTVVPYDSVNLGIDGVATLVRVGQPENSELQNVCRIGVTGEGEGSITYSGENFWCQFPITGKAAEGGSGSEAANGTLIAFWSSMDPVALPYELLPEYSSPLLFGIGSAENPTILTWADYESGALRPEGVVTLMKDTWSGTENLFQLGVSDYGSGAVVYTKDNVKYRFEVLEGKRLYARDSSNNMLSSVLVTSGTPMDVYLCYGTSKDYTYLSADQVIVPTGSVISVSDSSTEDMVTLSASGAGTATLYYNDFELDVRGVSYGFYAVSTRENIYTTDITFGKNFCDLYFLYVGVPGNAQQLTWSDFNAGRLSSTGITQFFCYNMPGNPDNTFFIGTGETVGTGSVTYKDGDTTYSIPVKCVENPDAAAESVLFAKSVDSGDCFSGVELTGRETTQLIFYYGNIFDPDNAIELTPSDGLIWTVDALNVTYSEEDACWTIGSKSGASGTVSYQADGKIHRFAVDVQSSGSPSGGATTTTIDYNGTEVTVFIGLLQEQTMTPVYGYGDLYNDSVTHDFSFQFILGALQDFEATNQTPPPQEFFNCISDVNFYVSDWSNEDGSTTTPNFSLSETESFNTGGAGTLSGINTWRTFLTAPNGHGFNASLAMDFTFTLNGQSQTYTLVTSGGYNKVEDLYIHADNASGPAGAYLNTAGKLNAVLSSREALESWLEEYFPNEKKAYALAENLYLYLPGVDYKEVIVQNCPMPNGYGGAPSIHFIGASNEGTPLTKMPGFLNKGGHGSLRSVHFIGDKSQKITYNNKSFTCGILIDGPVTGWNDMVHVDECIFENLDYGIYDTPTGYHGSTSCCTFINCEYGLYIDCKGKADSTGGANDEHVGNTFNNCKFAVWVKSLPEYITPYMLRVVDNVFLNNHKDIKVTTPGRHFYYFYRNYYYGTYTEVSPFSTRQEGRAAEVEIADGSEAVVLTSPSRRYQNDSETLWLYEESTAILNSEASGLQIAQDALSDLNKQKEISIIDNASTGEAVAVWTFGTEGGTAE